MSNAKIDPDLRQTLQMHGSSEFALLLRVDKVDDSRERDLLARSVVIRRRLMLVPTYAVTCSGATGLELLEQPWVRHVEEDRPVYAL